MARGDLNDPKHWYDRAAEMRVLADEMRTPEARDMMYRLADDYDRLGDRAAQRARSGALLLSNSLQK